MIDLDLIKIRIRRSAHQLDVNLTLNNKVNNLALLNKTKELIQLLKLSDWDETIKYSNKIIKECEEKLCN
jgi:hypothetical protein